MTSLTQHIFLGVTLAVPYVLASLYMFPYISKENIWHSVLFHGFYGLFNHLVHYTFKKYCNNIQNTTRNHIDSFQKVSQQRY